MGCPSLVSQVGRQGTEEYYRCACHPHPGPGGHPTEIQTGWTVTGKRFGLEAGPGEGGRRSWALSGCRETGLDIGKVRHACFAF
jgi:hypothetical protein